MQNKLVSVDAHQILHHFCFKPHFHYINAIFMYIKVFSIYAINISKIKISISTNNSHQCINDLPQIFF